MKIKQLKVPKEIYLYVFSIFQENFSPNSVGRSYLKITSAPESTHILATVLWRIKSQNQFDNLKKCLYYSSVSINMNER